MDPELSELIALGKKTRYTVLANVNSTSVHDLEHCQLGPNKNTTICNNYYVCHNYYANLR